MKIAQSQLLALALIAASVFAIRISKSAEPSSRSSVDCQVVDAGSLQLNSDLQKVSQFASMSLIPSEKSAPSAKTPRLITEFSWALARVVKASYVPATQFIDDNLLLYPSSDNHHADLAILSYKVNGIVLLVIQTGGPEGRIAIYKYLKPPTTQPEDVKATATNQVSELLNQAPDMQQATVAKVGELTTFTWPKSAKPFTRCGIIMTGRVAGISFLKYDLVDIPAAHVPDSADWFAYAKMLSKDPEHPAKRDG